MQSSAPIIDQSKHIRDFEQNVAKLQEELQHAKDKNRRQNLPGAKSVKKKDLEKKVVQLQGISEFNLDASLKSKEKCMKLERDARTLVQQMEVLKLENHELKQQLVLARSGAEGNVVQFKYCTFNNTNNVMNNLNAAAPVGSGSVAFGTTVSTIPTYPMDGDFTHRRRPLPAVTTPEVTVREPTFKSRCNREAGGKLCKSKCPYFHQVQINFFSKDKIDALPFDFQDSMFRNRVAGSDITS